MKDHADRPDRPTREDARLADGCGASGARPLLAREIAARLGAIDGVVAVALGGSVASGAADAGSDIDLYVYAPEDVPLDARRALANGRGMRVELDNRFWEPGDEWTDRATGIHVDIMYRSPAWIEDALARVLERHEASIGYSTCLWHSVRTSIALHDPSGWYATLAERAATPYPDALVRAILAKNLPLLRGSASAFEAQLLRAAGRGDAVAANHRAAALLASSFDVLFALNRLAHPGEKRQLEHALAACARCPDDLDGRTRALLAALGAFAMAVPGATSALHDAVSGLVDAVLETVGGDDRA